MYDTLSAAAGVGDESRDAIIRRLLRRMAVTKVKRMLNFNSPSNAASWPSDNLMFSAAIDDDEIGG
jgi:hypothetical protein